MFSRVFYLAWPILLANMAQPLLGLVDTAVIGHLDNDKYLAGVALGNSIMSFIFWGFNFLSMGLSGFVSQARGASDSEQCVLFLKRYVVVASSFAVVLVVVSPWLISLALTLMSAALEVTEQAQLYLQVRALGVPAILITMTLLGWYLGMANTRVALLTNIVAQSMNIILDVVLVAVFDFKTVGIAIGTVIAEYCGLGVLLWSLSRTWRTHQYSVYKHNLSEILKNLLQVFQVSHQLFVRTFVLLFVMAYFNALSASVSTTLLAANAVLLVFITLISSSLDGFAAAAETLCGEAVGAKDSTRLKQALVSTGAFSVSLAMTLTLFFALAGPWMIAGLTSQNNIVSTALQYLPFVVAMPAITFISYWLDGVFIGLRKTRAMRNVVLAAFVLGFLPCRFLLGPLDGYALWISFCCFHFIRSFLMFVSFCFIYRRLIN